MQRKPRRCDISHSWLTMRNAKSWGEGGAERSLSLRGRASGVRSAPSSRTARVFFPYLVGRAGVEPDDARRAVGAHGIPEQPVRGRLRFVDQVWVKDLQARKQAAPPHQLQSGLCRLVGSRPRTRAHEHDRPPEAPLRTLNL